MHSHHTGPQDIEDNEEDRDLALASRVDVRAQDADWHSGYMRGEGVRPGYDYEDYAPAFCVGAIGRMQYGGSYEDAEKSLLANWERIKGDSRLLLQDAHQAIRAAWQRTQPLAQPPLTSATPP
ncbi:MAG: hypothetical protein EOO25_14430 [Comamonadaceae bacterium]|nr:MAG: hypothetical protein EOO25_14430 [Comamonadaceae bacterium]